MALVPCESNSCRKALLPFDCKRKMSSLAALVILFVCILTSNSTSALSPDCRFEHCLRVNNSYSNGSGSLYQALVEAHQYNSSVEIQMPLGEFSISDKDVATFQKWDGFTLTGQGMKVTSIKCTGKDMGIFFNASRNLAFRGLSISGCGRVFITTSINSTNDQAAEPVSYVRSKTGMYFNSCSNLSFEDFRIYGCFGAGITIYNTNGNVVFRNCNIQTNFLNKDDPFPGGGGVIMETSHCTPGDTNCHDNSSVVDETRNSFYAFHHCLFSSNRATSRFGALAVSFPHGKAHMGLGKGGGLTITLKGRAYSNQVTIDSCEFGENLAEWGGAIYLSFGDHSINNSVVISNSLFRGNNFDQTGITVGGAVRIAMVSYPPDQELWGDYISDVTGNSIVFTDTRFLQNFGSWGGAVSFVTTHNVPGQNIFNSLLFKRCTFLQNRAYMASSAVDISTWKPDVIDSHEQYLMPVFEDCTFLWNAIQFENITNYPMGKGALYIEALPTKFLGTNTFYGNSDTALVVSDTYVVIMTSSCMNFTSNTGRTGGALAFIGNSWMIVHENTYLLFNGNSVGAYGLGGAVYSVHFGAHDLYYRMNCFFQYHKFNEPPSRWNTTFLFRNNIADNINNSIYTTSLFPCMWPHLGSSDDMRGGNVFCDNSVWIFEGESRNCHNEIATGPGNIKVTKIIYDVIPGWNVSLGVKTYDDYNRPLPTVLVANPSPIPFMGGISIASKSSYITGDNIVIQGVENTINNLVLMTLDPRPIASTLRINVMNCPVGFRPVSCENEHSVGQTCNCICIHNVSGLSCDDNTKEAHLHRYNCITHSSNNDSLFTITRCPYNNQLHLLLPRNSSYLNERVCRKARRTGYLCSECMKGHGVSVNRYDYSCVPCKDKKYSWALFLLIELGPITLACCLVVLFRVKLVSPSMNAFVFFSQIVSIKYSHNSNSWLFGADYINPSLATPIFFMYGIWNLDFFREVIHGICLHENLNTLHILTINYVKALYPMLVLMVCFICIKLYDNHVRVFRILWKPFHYSLKVLYRDHKPTTSIIDSFTTLIILSYTRIMYVSFPLVSIVPIHQFSADGNVVELKYYYYFHQSLSYSLNSRYFFYFLLGFVALIVFVVIPPLFLILYSLPFVQSCIGRLNSRLRIALGTFVDSFLGAFRDGTDGDRNCRWFGGAYLLFRVVVFSVYISQTSWLYQYFYQQIFFTLAIFLFAIVRPYKIDFYNYLDISFFTLLAILNSMSFFNSQNLLRYDDIEKRVFYINYTLLFLPMLYLVFLLGYRFLLWRGLVRQWAVLRKTRERITNELLSEEKEREYDSEIRFPYANEELPDRLVHPHLYSSLSPMSTLHSDMKKEITQKANTENGHLLPTGGASAESAYGSIAKKKERSTVP